MTATHTGRPHHPAPNRARIGALAVMFSLFGAPASWVVLMAADTIASSHACYPHTMPLVEPLWQDMSNWLALVSGLCLLISVIAGVFALKAWRCTRHEIDADKKHAVDRGIGRTRFLAVMGLMSSGLFIIAILLTIAALGLIPACRPWL